MILAARPASSRFHEGGCSVGPHAASAPRESSEGCRRRPPPPGSRPEISWTFSNRDHATAHGELRSGARRARRQRCRHDRGLRSPACQPGVPLMGEASSTIHRAQAPARRSKPAARGWSPRLSLLPSCCTSVTPPSREWTKRGRPFGREPIDGRPPPTVNGWSQPLRVGLSTRRALVWGGLLPSSTRGGCGAQSAGARRTLTRVAADRPQSAPLGPVRDLVFEAGSRNPPPGLVWHTRRGGLREWSATTSSFPSGAPRQRFEGGADLICAPATGRRSPHPRRRAAGEVVRVQGGPARGPANRSFIGRRRPIGPSASGLDRPGSVIVDVDGFPPCRPATSGQAVDAALALPVPRKTRAEKRLNEPSDVLPESCRPPSLLRWAWSTA